MSRKTLALYLCIVVILLAGVGFGLYAIVSTSSGDLWGPASDSPVTTGSAPTAAAPAIAAPIADVVWVSSSR